MDHISMDVDLSKTYHEKNYAVLLADDQKFMIRNLQRYFDDFFEITTATTLQEGIDALSEHPTAVVVADHQMHGGDGLALLEHVRDNHEHVRRVIITADRHEQIVVDMMGANLAHSFVFKPTVKAQLHQAIAEQFEIFLSNLP